MNEFDSKINFKYSDRYVFFLDILGSKNLIGTSTCNNFALDKVKLIAQLFREAQKRYKKPHWDSHFIFPISTQGMIYDKTLAEENIKVDMSLFSDSIIISYMPQKTDRFLIWYKQMYQILNDICRFQFDFALNGIFLRGGMSYGKLFHDGNICFGPALINAVELEKKAVNPCIAVDNIIIEKIFNDRESNEIDDYSPGYKDPHVLKDFARELYLIYFNRIDVYGKNLGEKVFMVDWLLSRFYDDSKNITRIKPIIETELQKDYIPKIVEKYEWLKDYYNHTISFFERDTTQI